MGRIGFKGIPAYGCSTLCYYGTLHLDRRLIVVSSSTVVVNGTQQAQMPWLFWIQEPSLC